MTPPRYNDKLTEKDLKNINSVYNFVKTNRVRPQNAVRRPKSGNPRPTVTMDRFMTDEEFWQTPEYKRMKDKALGWRKK